MIAALLLLALQAATSIDGLPIGGLPRQALPARGCAAYLFTTGTTRTFAAMAAPTSLRIAVDGKLVDLPRVAGPGAEVRGLAREGEYRVDGIAARLSMTIVERQDLAQGAAVTEAVLTLERAGKDAVAVPLAGLVGCAA